MRKILFVFAVLYCTTAIAQNKAVAVTEVVDKEDKVSYATEIMVRTRLTAAISMKQGYSAYDRVDLQSIMKEQDFQRTGLVDDATIKRLGEMTGASLILIPEVAMGDDGQIYVAVKMLDVTTAKTLMSTGELMGSSSAEVEEGCRVLTARILGIRSNSSDSSAVPDKPITLFGYLHVFPTDIGEFQTLPSQLLSAINNKATYGYDSWRLPTTEELSIMRANSHMIPGFKNAEYLCSDSSTKGLARLVTTEMSNMDKMKEKKIRKKAIFNLLGIRSNFERYMILDTIVVCAWEGSYYVSYYSLKAPSHPNINFRLIYDRPLVSKYLNYTQSNIEICYDYDGSNMVYINDQDIRIYHRFYLAKLNASRICYINEKSWIDYANGAVIHHESFDAPINCSALFMAELPSEQAIIQEMRRIKESNTPIDSF